MVFKKKVDKELEPLSSVSPTETETEATKPEPEPSYEQCEWILVEGIKGTDMNMQGHGNFQFALGETYLADGEIEMCRNGFHLSLDLLAAERYHRWQERSRYFKVKALVRKEDLKQYGNFYLSSIYINPAKNDKLVAKQITFLEEISLDKVHEILRLNEQAIPKDFFLSYYASNLAYNDYKMLYFRDALKDKYSPTFIEVLYNRSAKPLRTLQLALALAEEGVSLDVRTYLLLQEDKS